MRNTLFNTVHNILTSSGVIVSVTTYIYLEHVALKSCITSQRKSPCENVGVPVRLLRDEC